MSNQAIALGYMVGLTKRAEINPSSIPLMTTLGGAGLGALTGLFSKKDKLSKILRNAMIGGAVGGLGGTALTPAIYKDKLAPDGGYLDALKAMFSQSAEAGTPAPAAPAAPKPEPELRPVPERLSTRMSQSTGKLYGGVAGTYGLLAALMHALSRRKADRRMAFIASGGDKARAKALYSKVRRPVWKDLIGVPLKGLGYGALGYGGGRLLGYGVGKGIENIATNVRTALDPIALK